MSKIIIILLSLICIISLSFVSIDGHNDISIPEEKIYAKYCSSCHGEQVDAFVDRVWKHGNSKKELVESISNGYVNLGMPAWKGIIDSKDIDKLVELILKKID